MLFEACQPPRPALPRHDASASGGSDEHIMVMLKGGKALLTATEVREVGGCAWLGLVLSITSAAFESY